MENTNIDFKKSNYYLQNVGMLQTTIGFVNPFSIDIFVKESFGALDGKLLITGGNIELLNKDHITDETFICYKLSRTDALPLLKTDGRIWFDFTKWEFFEADNIFRNIQSVPYISLFLLTLLMFLMLSFSPFLARIFKYINAIGLLITILYFGFKLAKAFYDTIRSKAIDYNGVKVTYEKDTDIMDINEEFIAILKNLNTQYDIKKIAIFNGEFYIKQNIEKITLWEVIKEIFRKPEIDDESIEQKVGETIDHLVSLDFIKSQLTKEDDK